MPSLETNRGFKRAREARLALAQPADARGDDLLEVVESSDGLAVLVLDLGEHVAGAYLPRPGAATILVNGAQGTPRQRFTLAHELGHHRLGHSAVVDKPSNLTDYYSHDPREVEANAFAAEFLMPKRAVLRWDAERGGGRVTLENIVRLAGEYGVSAQMVRYRLTTAGVLSDGAQAAKLDAEIGEGLHRTLAGYLGLTDLEDELTRAATRLPRIPPAVLARPFGRLLAGDLSPERFAALSGQEPSAVRQMLDNLGLAA